MNERVIKYNDHFSPCFESVARYLILKGGAGSGKSVFAAQKIVGRMINEKGHRFLVMRKVSNTIRESVWALIKNTFEQFGHDHLIRINKTDRVIEYIPNGNQILFAGVDDPEKLKSITGITGAWCEEITEFDESDIDQLDLRLRGETPWFKQIIGTFNPIDEQHWIKAKYFDDNDPDTFTHESTFRHNHFLDSEYKRILLNRFKSNPNWFNIYVNGHWGQPQTGLEFYHQFNISKHVIGRPMIDGDAPIHVTFDFNVVPHVTACLWQIVHDRDKAGTIIGTTAICFDEICLEHPLNNTPSAAKRFFANYGDHTGGVWVYGDPAGRARDTRSETGRNDFDIIFDMIRPMTNVMDRVQRVAPNVANRGAWINQVFDNDHTKLKIRIADHCSVTLGDYQHVKQAADGSKSKQKIRDKNTKISFEKYGHASDANDYFLTTAFETEFREFSRGVPESQKRKIIHRGATRSKGY